MSACCSTLTAKFDEAYVAAELASRRDEGPGKTALRLAEAIASVRSEPEGLAGASALDIGAGFGDLLGLLFSDGLGEAVHVEASPAYSRAARELAREGGYADRVRFVVGDFVEVANGLPVASHGTGDAAHGDGSGGGALAEDGASTAMADIVMLDRVICCYPDMPALLDAAGARARDVLALSAPRSLWPVRLVIGVRNLVRRLKGDPFRTFVHAWPEVEARLRASGFERVRGGGTPIWRIAVYRRARRARGGRSRSKRRTSRAIGTARPTRSART